MLSKIGAALAVRVIQLRDALRRFGVSKRLFLILTVQVVLLLSCYTVLIAISTSGSRRQLDTSIYQMNYTVLRDTKNKVATLDTVTKFPLFRTYSGNANPLYQSLKRYPQDTIQTVNAFLEQSTAMTIQYPVLDVIFLFGPDGRDISAKTGVSPDLSLANLGNCAGLPWFQQALSAKGALCLHSSQAALSTGYNARRGVMYGARSVVDSYSDFSSLGVLLVGIDITDILSLFEKQRLFSQQRFAVFTQDGARLFGQEEVEIAGLTLSPGAGYTRLMRRPIPEEGMVEFDYHITYDEALGLYSVIQTPASVLRSSLSLPQFSFFIIGLFLILLSLTVFISIIRSITHPLERLVAACNRMGKGDFSARMQVSSRDELGYLTESFNKMSEKVETLINEVYLRDLNERDLELQMLRSQINPHFLYNTLESMRMAAYTQGVPKLGEMCLLLAKVLRYGVSLPSDLVTVQEELSHLQDYMELQDHRFQGSIRFTVRVDESLLQARVIKLILQPILENAINHGVGGPGKRGQISVLGYRREDLAVFTISDNGDGIEAEKLQLLRDYIDNKNEAFRSIGLRNIQRRVVLYYGKAYGLTIESRPGRGTVVSLRVPLGEERAGGPLTPAAPPERAV